MPRNITEYMRNGYVYASVVYDEGRPVDIVHEETNFMYEKLTGLRNVVGKKTSEIFPDLATIHPEFVKSMFRVAETGIPDRIEIFFKPLEKWFDISVYSPEKKRIVAIFDDITERKHYETALTHSEERFRRLFEDHSAAMILLDPHTGNIVDANLSAADFYGWPKDELCKMNIRQITNTSDEMTMINMEKARTSAQNRFEFRDRRADNSLRDIEVFSSRVEIDGKEFIHAIIHDVTDRKRLEQVDEFRLQLLQMADSCSVSQLLQTTLDEAETITGSSIGFIFFVSEDQNALFQEVSTNTFRNMCKAEGKGQHYSIDKAGVWADAVRERKAVIHNDYASLAHRKGMPDGHAEVIREMVIPILRDNRIKAIMGLGNKPTAYDDDDVTLVGMLANQIWDIVEKKMAEEARIQLQTQLEHSKKMEMVGLLAAGIAHEINNPLNFIAINNVNLESYCHDLCDLVAVYRQTVEKIEDFPDLADDVRKLRNQEQALDIDLLLTDIPEIIQEMKSGLERVSAITQSMKGFSHKNASNLLIQFDINKAINDALVIAKNEYATIASIRLELDDIPSILCNPSQINQVFLNLIINSTQAIKSQNRRSPGTIEIKTWHTDDRVFCSITDNGPGIPDEIRDKIFSPFFTTKEFGKGTGLGLSISHDIIVNKHHGTISTDSLPGGGAVFTVALPLNNHADS